MANKNEPKQAKNKRKQKKDWSFYAIIVCLVLILIPTVALGVILFDAMSGTGTPIVGDRFANDLDPAITDEQLTQLSDTLTQWEETEAVDLILRTGTLRVYVKVSVESPKELFNDLAGRIYNTLNEMIPVETYFTSTDTTKQYDLEVNVYNMSEVAEEEKEGFVYYLLTKNSLMELPSGQFLSDPMSSELVEEFWQIIEERNNPIEQEGSEDEGESTEDAGDA